MTGTLRWCMVTFSVNFMSSKEKFFGTDGVRGVANQGIITPEVALRLGQAAAQVLVWGAASRAADRPFAIIGRDTRRSGQMLEAALAAGLNSAGVDVELAGVVPTPAVSYLVRDRGAALGLVVSASHNPPGDNGIKFFAGDGYKLPDATEAALTEIMLAGGALPEAERRAGGEIGWARELTDAADRYIAMAVASMSDLGEQPLAGLRISLDAANGASSRTSVEILEALGADLKAHHRSPDGDNINVDCGCTFPGVLSALVAADGSAVGISHDGDADRILMCDEGGSPIAGDELMALVGCHLLETGGLAGKTLVATKMSNFGLDECIAARGGKVERTDIGDRHVINRMREIGANFGGEQSGHLICRDQNTTGDGILAALAALRVMKETGRPLSELRRVMVAFPQKLVNLRVKAKPEVGRLAAAPLIAEVEEALGDAGRVLVRYSGTEPKIRVMVEGKDADFVGAKADAIAAAIAEEIGE